MDNDGAVAFLVEAGFNAEEAAWALSATGGCVERAAAELLMRDQHTQGDQPDRRLPD